MKLMVVEDEKVIRNGLLKHVPWQKLGVWEVQAAENGEKALELAETFHPDIVLSDIRMPGMSGIELCRTLREKYPEIEIIFSTGYADKEYLKVAIDLHAVGYVEKPVNANLLAENVKEAVKRVGERRTPKLSAGAGYRCFHGTGRRYVLPDCQNSFRQGRLWKWLSSDVRKGTESGLFTA